jgi:hypothetical protein
MEPNTFVNRLACLAPSVEALARIGLSETQANDFRDNYFCQKRQTVVRETNEILALLKGWDLSSVEIGMVRFAQQPSEIPGKVLIGKVEADPLMLMQTTGEILVEDLHAPGHILWVAARSGSTLLDALIPAAEFLTKRGLEEIDVEDTHAARVVAKRCAMLAGGERYVDFFSMLLGAE